MDKDKEELKIKQAVAFVILMQDNILEKHPSYLLEKFRQCTNHLNPEALLDENNREIFNKYVEKFLK